MIKWALVKLHLAGSTNQLKLNWKISATIILQRQEFAC